METNLTTNNIHLATNENGIVTTTTTEVAKVFGRRHDNIMRAIEKIECSDEFGALNFEGTEYSDVQGKVRNCYNLTKDGFIFLVMSFTGKKASQFKEIYINEFNRMEAILRNSNKEINLTNITHESCAWIGTREIATLSNQSKATILEKAYRLRDYASNQPQICGVRVIASTDDDLYLNLLTFLILDLGSSFEMSKLKFRVIDAFQTYEQQYCMDEKEEELQEREKHVADFKESIRRLSELSAQLIVDSEWKSDITDDNNSNQRNNRLNIFNKKGVRRWQI